MLDIYIDADACAVKDEVYKVAARHKLKVIVVANQYLNVPMDVNIQMQAVPGNFDAADDWIVEHITNGDIVITSDILLAERCVKGGAKVLGQKGKEFDEENIGDAVSNRELMQHLRDLGQSNTGPSAMKKTDRSNFLSQLDRIIQQLLRSK